MDFLALVLVRTIYFILNSLPKELAVAVIEAVVRLVVLIQPKYKRIADKNLSLVFPEKTAGEKRSLTRASCRALARLLVDFGRMRSYDRAWCESHIENLRDFEEICRNLERSGRPGLFLSAHVGSFELLSHSCGILGHKLSFVVRDFQLPRLNSWWNGIRTYQGNEVISRKGAFRGLLGALKSGRSLGVLCDQNVKRQQAVFVDFFGRQAASTGVCAALALEHRLETWVLGLTYVGGDKYRFFKARQDFSDIIADESLSKDEKIRKTVERYTKDLERFILTSPGEWFWFHRRWKTAPEGAAEDFYTL